MLSRLQRCFSGLDGNILGRWPSDPQLMVYERELSDIDARCFTRISCIGVKNYILITPRNIFDKKRKLQHSANSSSSQEFKTLFIDELIFRAALSRPQSLNSFETASRKLNSKLYDFL